MYKEKKITMIGKENWQKHFYSIIKAYGYFFFNFHGPDPFKEILFQTRIIIYINTKIFYLSRLEM